MDTTQKWMDCTDLLSLSKNNKFRNGHRISCCFSNSAFRTFYEFQSIDHHTSLVVVVVCEW